MSILRPTPHVSTLRLLVPPLTPTAYKGQAGKVAVLGGCAEYTGAPYYAAISALKLGADLSHIFCDEAAAVPIKSYSPEVIVHGCLRGGTQTNETEQKRQAESVCRWFPALTAIVVGPGLGRDETLQAVAEIVIERAIAASLPCVIDADALAIVLRRPDLVCGSRWTVLTPNKPEYGRLLKVFGCANTASTDDKSSVLSDDVAELARLTDVLNGPVVVRKGNPDLVCDRGAAVANDEAGSLKRSGGQGDVLAGTIATLLSWSRSAPSLPEDTLSPQLLAAYTGCFLTRRFSRDAFMRHGRAMTAPDLVAEIGQVFSAFQVEE